MENQSADIFPIGHGYSYLAKRKPDPHIHHPQYLIINSGEKRDAKESYRYMGDLEGEKYWNIFHKATQVMHRQLHPSATNNIWDKFSLHDEDTLI